MSRAPSTLYMLCNVMDLLAILILMDRDSVPEPNTLCGALSDGIVFFTMVTRPWDSDPAGI